MQVMPEKNLVKDFYPHKKETKHQNLCIFSDLYPLLLRLCRLQEVIQKLVKHILSNGPHLVSPQQALEVPQTQNFRGNKLLFCDRNYERPCIICIKTLSKMNFYYVPVDCKFCFSLESLHFLSPAGFRAWLRHNEIEDKSPRLSRPSLESVSRGMINK